MMQRRKIKNRYLWIGFILCLILGVVLIWLVNKADNTTPLLVLLVVTFLAMTIFLQTAMSRTFRYKPKPKNYISKEYPLEDFDSFEKILTDNKFQIRRSSFGIAYTKIIGATAYKVVIIKDGHAYFNQEENADNDNKTTKGLDKCNKFIGFEIFSESTAEIITKLPDFSFQGNNIVYEGFYYDAERKVLIEPNVLEITEEHLKEYNMLKELLKITE